jgi:DNA-binding FadR family transcriptional regulator
VRELGFDIANTPDRALRFHRAIFEQVKAGNSERARQAMRDHLAEAERTMRKALAMRASSAASSAAARPRP